MQGFPILKALVCVFAGLLLSVAYSKPHYKLGLLTQLNTTDGSRYVSTNAYPSHLKSILEAAVHRVNKLCNAEIQLEYEVLLMYQQSPALVGFIRQYSIDQVNNSTVIPTVTSSCRIYTPTLHRSVNNSTVIPHQLPALVGFIRRYSIDQVNNSTVIPHQLPALVGFIRQYSIDQSPALVGFIRQYSIDQVNNSTVIPHQLPALVGFIRQYSIDQVNNSTVIPQQSPALVGFIRQYSIDQVNNSTVIPQQSPALVGFIRQYSIDQDFLRQYSIDQVNNSTVIPQQSPALVGFIRRYSIDQVNNSTVIPQQSPALVGFIRQYSIDQVNNSTVIPHQLPALVGFIRRYSIDQIGVVVMDDSVSLEINAGLQRMIQSFSRPHISIIRNVTCANTSHAIRQCLYELNKAGIRAVVLIAQHTHAAPLLDEIFEMGMYGKGWTWITSTGIITDPLTNNLRSRQAVLEGFIGLASKGAEGPVYFELLGQLLKNKTGLQGVDTLSMDPSHHHDGQIIDAVNVVTNVLITTALKNLSRNATREELMQGLKEITQATSTVPSATGLDSKIYFDNRQDGPTAYDVINVVVRCAPHATRNPMMLITYVNSFKDGKVELVGSYASEKYVPKRSPVFPGGLSKPIIKALHYKLAAFPPLTTMPNLAQEWVSAFKIAVEKVNRDPTLQVTFAYSVFDEGTSAASCRGQTKTNLTSFDLILSSSVMCSATILNTTAGCGIPVVSFTSAPDQLLNKTQYPLFVQAAPTYTAQGRALAEIVLKYKWTQVGIVSSETSFASGLTGAVQAHMKSRGIALSGSWRIREKASTSDMRSEFTKMKYANNITAVNILLSDPIITPFLLKAAKDEGLTGSGWTWLVSDGVITSFDEGNTSRDVKEASQGIVGVGPKGGSGVDYDDFVTSWKAYSKASLYTAQVYDAVYAVAHATSGLYRNGHVTRTTAPGTFGELFMAGLKNVSFLGVTGVNVSFDSSGDVSGLVEVRNYVGNDWSVVGEYSSQSDTLTLQAGRDIVWPGGSFTAYSQDVKRPDNYLQLVIVLGVVLSCFVVAAIGLSLYFSRIQDAYDLRTGNLDTLNLVTIIENKFHYKDKFRAKKPENIRPITPRTPTTPTIPTPPDLDEPFTARAPTTRTMRLNASFNDPNTSYL
ncbi:predicted protein [Nematostella vectensis]|uniref:Receptor ligand binding region domain-containing protein n=1 Tax=Nematostella vectensis TaxID=45351 RepID=A7SRM1_NEMVE|nr:predicted protein [Nematostella vectensis]|eukprot:XP_001625745.1 predicted protein [Nematostella vectensis]